MKSVRNSIAWNYGTTALFFFCWYEMKVESVWDCQIFIVARLFKHFHACQYSNQTMKYFNIVLQKDFLENQQYSYSIVMYSYFIWSMLYCRYLVMTIWWLIWLSMEIMRRRPWSVWWHQCTIRMRQLQCLYFIEYCDQTVKNCHWKWFWKVQEFVYEITISQQILNEIL